MMWANPFILAGCLVPGITLFLLLLRRLRPASDRSWNLESIDSARNIREIIDQSIVERSKYELVLDGEGESLKLEGVPMAWSEQGTLLIDLPSHRDATQEFAEKPFTVHFRIGKGDLVQFFSFYASAQGLERRGAGHSWQLFLHLSMPTRLHRGQRRQHFRLQPRTSARVTVDLYQEARGLQEAVLFRNVPVDDISAGGLRVIVDARPELQELGVGGTVMLEVKFQPCIFRAENATVPPLIRFRSVVLENSFPTPAKRLMRFQFLAREINSPGKERPYFTEDLDWINDDISRWIHACHRNALRQWRLSTQPGERKEADSTQLSKRIR